jgi:hypothetical protein
LIFAADKAIDPTGPDASAEEGPMTFMFEHRSRGPVFALWQQLQG